MRGTRAARRRQPARALSRRSAARPRAAGARHAARLRARRRSISCARCERRRPRRRALRLQPEHVAALRRPAGAGTRHHPRHRPLRQLGARRRRDAARLQSAADHRRDGRSQRDRQRARGARSATASASTPSKCGKSLDTALQIRKRLADNRIVAMLMDRHLGRDRVAGDVPRPAAPGSCGRRR